MSRNNEGFSLVELIIVIAVIAIISTAGFTLTGILPGRQISSVTTEFKTQLEKTRTNAMSYSDAYLVLRKDKEGIHVDSYVSKSSSVIHTTRRIGNHNIQVLYKMDTSENAEYIELGEGESESIKFTFNRNTGGFGITSINNIMGNTCVGIKFKIGSKEMELALSKLTGLISVP